ncbi:MAG: hypothetical protein LBN40_05195 [Oscillospiraceae bacterium]|jgi:hypothetical protein|nr:hypothetical protein [Oscillospiraceae bacterium]
MKHLKQIAALLLASLFLSSCFLFQKEPEVIVIGSFETETIVLENPDTILQIAAGRNTLYYLTEYGEVYADSAKPGDKPNGAKAVLVDIDDGCNRIAPGVAVGDSKHIYRFGWQYIAPENISTDYSTGTEFPELAFSAKPREIPFNRLITEIYSTEYFTNFLTEDGEVYTFGAMNSLWGGFGNGFVGAKYYPSEMPVKVNFPEKITDIACGEKHTIAIGKSGQLYAYGSYAEGQFGENFERTEDFATLEIHKGVKLLETAAYTTLLVMKSSPTEIMAFGYPPAGFTLSFDEDVTAIYGSYSTEIFSAVGEDCYGVGNFSSPFFNLKDAVRKPQIVAVKEEPVVNVVKRGNVDIRDMYNIGKEKPPMKILDAVKGYATFVFKGDDGFFYRYDPDLGYGKKILVYS